MPVSTSPTAFVGPSGDTTGATDSGAIDIAIGAGAGTVQLGTGQYWIERPVLLPSGVVLTGPASARDTGWGAVLGLPASYTATSAILLPGGSEDQQVSFLTIDGTAAPASTVAGVTTSGGVSSVVLRDLLITGAGIHNGISVTSGTSPGWRAARVEVWNPGNFGVSLSNATDGIWEACHVLGATVSGWQLNSLPNTKLIGCKAEWSVDNFGYHITGSWGTGTGSGGMQMIGCSTDRNGEHGVSIDATGNAPILISGLMCRRDGALGASSGYAGLLVNGPTVPVVVAGMTCYPGVNDDGTGTDGPEYGVSVSSPATYFALSDAYLHAVTAGTNGLTTGNGAAWRNVATRAGSTGSPGSVTLVADSA